MQLSSLLQASLLCVALAGLSAQALETPAAPAPVPVPVTAPALDVDTILQRNAEARGGLAAWRKVQSLSYSGVLDAGHQRPQPDAEFANPNASLKERHHARVKHEQEVEAAAPIALPFTLEAARGRKTRLEVTVSDRTAVQVYDGSTGWKLRPWLAGKGPQPYSAEELKLAADQADIDGWLLDARSKGNQVAVEGVDAVDGHAAYKLKVTLANGDLRHVWVDAQSFLEVRVEGARRMDGKLKAMYTELKDYRTVDGVRIPFLMETRMDGIQDVDRIVIEKAAVNPAIPAGHFAKP